MKKILVAVDGSDSADKAINKAKEIGRAFDSEITILHVIKDLSNPDTFYMTYPSGYDKALQEQIKKQSEELLDSYMWNFEGYGNEVNKLTDIGKPGDVITKIAKDGDYDLIVMGSRGLGTFTGAMLGSVSNKVVNRSSMSVLIVK